MRRIFLLCAVLVLALSGAPDALAASISQAAAAMGREIDRQTADRGLAPESLSLYVTTPAHIDDLEEANSLARQMQEELARWFVQAGYRVQEIRSGEDVLFDPPTGELLLTRRAELLGAGGVTSAAVLAGTYAVTPKGVRFNIRLVNSCSREVLGMSNMTVTMNGEVASLVFPASAGFGLIEPTVITRLP